jgi:HPt (histidine-containing phosphotransfer) domain-containing protein
MDTSLEQSLSDAMDKLWTRFLPEIQERITVLETANHALASNKLSHDQRNAAHSACHKLAGVLGTFGLTKGTVLAREAEIFYSGDAESDPSSITWLTGIAEQLKAIVASRK